MIGGGRICLLYMFIIRMPVKTFKYLILIYYSKPLINNDKITTNKYLGKNTHKHFGEGFSFHVE
jgi:hypothetical protein